MALDGSRAEYYREQARQVRELAVRRRNSSLRAEYEAIAEQYERHNMGELTNVVSVRLVARSVAWLFGRGVLASQALRAQSSGADGSL
jgi:hypothetical protein